jgi:hypothetical protein
MAGDDQIFRSQVRRLHVLSTLSRCIFHYVPCIIFVSSHLISALSQYLIILNPIHHLMSPPSSCITISSSVFHHLLQVYALLPNLLLESLLVFNQPKPHLTYSECIHQNVATVLGITLERYSREIATHAV